MSIRLLIVVSAAVSLETEETGEGPRLPPAAGNMCQAGTGRGAQLGCKIEVDATGS